MPVNQLIRLLMVEDSIGDAYLYKRLLSEVSGRSFVITHVTRLRDALKIMDRQLFDAVLLDLNLADVCGVNNISSIKSHNREMPVIVLTGMDSKQMAMQAILAGADDYLVKGRDDAITIGNVVFYRVEKRRKRAALSA